jgi:hypothetical protein
MAYVSKNTTQVYIEKEVTEGTLVAPSAGDKIVAVLDGIELNGEKESIERNVLKTGISKEIPMTGIRRGTGSLPVEMTANKVVGVGPTYGLLLESLLGEKNVVSTAITTKATGNTTTTLAIEDADILEFAIGDIILVKIAGNHHLSPITAIDDTTSSAKITLLFGSPIYLVAVQQPFPNSVVIEKYTSYRAADSGHPSLSIHQYLEDALHYYLSGAKVSSMSVDNFTVGQLPTLSFSVNGLDYQEKVEGIPVGAKPAVFNEATPALVLGACFYVDGVLVPIQEISFNVENTLAEVTSTCAPNGLISQRITSRTVTFNFTTYADTTNVSWFTKFDRNTTFNLFIYARNPKIVANEVVAGEYDNQIAFYIPVGIATNVSKTDSDGLLTLSVEGQAGGDAQGKNIFISYI